MIVIAVIVVDIGTFLFYLWVLLQLRDLRCRPALIPGNITSPLQEVTVVLAARNEAYNIEQCILTLVEQQGVSKVIVVDDHSEDDTLQIASRFASKYPKLVVLSAPDLPEGWIGKSHALQFGSRHATTKYILFTDADVALKPGIVAAAITQMESKGLDHLSGQFLLKCKTASEEMCAPVFAASSSITLFSNAEKRGSAIGAFNMVRADIYRKCGEHERIKSSVVDDIDLARNLKSCGGKSEYLFLTQGVSVRLFKEFGGFFSLVYRTAFSYLEKRRFASFIAATLFLLVALVPGISFIILLLLHPNISFKPLSLFLLGILPYLLGLYCARETRYYHNAHNKWLFLYPIGMIYMASALMWAVVCSAIGKPISWRGRQYCSVFCAGKSIE